MINWKKWFGVKPKGFLIGGERTIQFTAGSREAFIHYRQPTGDEQLQFAHAMIEDNESALKELSTEVTPYKMHKITRERKLIPFAKMVFLRAECYYDPDGNDANSIEMIEKYLPHHLEHVAIEAYKLNDTHKKKD